MALTVRAAFSSEAACLSDLALRSKGYWGYDESFLKACRDELTLDEDLLRNDAISVAEVEGQVVGFYGLRGVGPELELSFLFVEPDLIGRGIGRALLAHGLEAALERGARRVRVVSDPSAEGFYLAMGAARVGAEPSQSIPGRSLPALVFTLPPNG